MERSVGPQSALFKECSLPACDQKRQGQQDRLLVRGSGNQAFRDVDIHYRRYAQMGEVSSSKGQVHRQAITVRGEPRGAHYAQHDCWLRRKSNSHQGTGCLGQKCMDSAGFWAPITATGRFIIRGHRLERSRGLYSCPTKTSLWLLSLMPRMPRTLFRTRSCCLPSTFTKMS